jgi:DNA-binding XRE family transcriptional regulator
MPNIGSVLKAEISRLARREIRAEVASLRKTASQQRTTIAALRREIDQVRKKLRSVGKPSASIQAADQGQVQLRFRRGGLATHRKKLGLSAQDYGALVGVTGQTIYKWEEGRARPRAAQLQAIAAVRGIGKREALARLEKLAAAPATKKAARKRKA